MSRSKGRRFGSQFIPQSIRGGMEAARLSQEERLRRLNGQAYALHKEGKLGEALAIYGQVLTTNKYDPFALHMTGILMKTLCDHSRAMGRTMNPRMKDVAMRFMAISVAANPENAAGISNFAKFKLDVGELEEARQLYEIASQRDPNLLEAWSGLGNTSAILGDRARAEECFTKALEQEPSDAGVRYTLCYLRLLKGDYERGWRDHEDRFASPTYVTDFGRPDLRAPKWNGEPFDGTLYVHQEQGAGDAIMMARYIAPCRERATTVIVEVITGLMSLFQAMYPDLQIVERGTDNVPAHDQQVPMMSFPFIFGSTLTKYEEMPLGLVDVLNT